MWVTTESWRCMSCSSKASVPWFMHQVRKNKQQNSSGWTVDSYQVFQILSVELPMKQWISCYASGSLPTPYNQTWTQPFPLHLCFVVASLTLPFSPDQTVSLQTLCIMTAWVSTIESQALGEILAHDRRFISRKALNLRDPESMLQGLINLLRKIAVG